MEFETVEVEPKTWLDKVQYYAAGLGLIAITGIMMYTVVMRYFLNRAPLWGEDVPRVIFVWLTLLSGGIAIRLGLNVRVTSFLDMMSPATRRATELTMNAIVLALLAVIIWFSFPIIRLGLTGTMLSTGWSEAVLSLPLPIGAAIMFYYQAERLVAAWRRP